MKEIYTVNVSLEETSSYEKEMMSNMSKTKMTYRQAKKIYNDIYRQWQSKNCVKMMIHNNELIVASRLIRMVSIEKKTAWSIL